VKQWQEIRRKKRPTWMSEIELKSNVFESCGRFSITLKEILVVVFHLHEPSRDSTSVALTSFISWWAWCFQISVSFSCSGGSVRLVNATSPCMYPVILG
jgi:hypothetical protein